MVINFAKNMIDKSNLLYPFVSLKSDASKELEEDLSLSRRSEKEEDTPKECEDISSLVAFENLMADVTDVMLLLLVENISGLTNDDFKLEFIRDFNVAVVTFQTYTGKIK